MQKIIIVGTSGCGKSTLALKLEQLLEIPQYDLDDYYWLPNWQPNPVYLKDLLDTILQQDSWIINGNYSKFQPLLWGNADTIIWLDFTLSRCFYQCLKRSLSRLISQTPCCNGNFETFLRTFFSKNSLFIWILKSYNRRKLSYNSLFENSDRLKRYLRFKTPKELNFWLNALSQISMI